MVINESRMRTMRQYNLPLLQKVRTVGRYDMPMLAKQDVTTPDTLMGFNYATGKKTVKHCGIHFFIDDYQFQRVWNQPDRYIAPLKRFQCVLTPDFSTYMDMPEAMKIYNVFRSRLIGAYWQSCGLKVIPTLQWAGPESFSYCFSGIPNNSTVAVSTVGANDNPTAELYWRLGMRCAIDRLEPEKILLYGDAIPFFDFGGAEVVAYENSNVERMKKWAEEDQARAQAVADMAAEGGRLCHRPLIRKRLGSHQDDARCGKPHGRRIGNHAENRARSHAIQPAHAGKRVPGGNQGELRQIPSGFQGIPHRQSTARQNLRRTDPTPTNATN